MPSPGNSTIGRPEPPQSSTSSSTFVSTFTARVLCREGSFHVTLFAVSTDPAPCAEQSAAEKQAIANATILMSPPPHNTLAHQLTNCDLMFYTTWLAHPAGSQ